MGIPVYFKTLVSQYQDSILIKHQIDSVGSIFFDLNCLIHPCCHGETDETIMIQKIIQSIHDLVDYSNVQDLIYIAVPCKDEDLELVLNSFKKINCKGLNITIPHKETILKYLDEIKTK